MSVEGQPITVLSVYTSFAWIQPTGGSSFTKAQADTLYLRKTVADTATALETFNNGILVENAADFNGNVNVYQNPLTLKDNAISPSSTITLSPITPGPYINITSFSNQVELLTGMLSFNNDGSVQVGATKNLTLGTIDANVSLGSVGKATTLNGTITVNGTINNYARLNASQAFSASQAFTGGVYNIFASTIGGNVGQTTQSLFANTANSNIALGNNSIVNLSGEIRIPQGTARVDLTGYGLAMDDNYSGLTGSSCSFSTAQLVFTDKSLFNQLDLTKDYIAMDSNIMSLSGYRTQISNDTTQAKMTLSNKNGNLNTTIDHTGIAASIGTSSTTLTTGSLNATTSLSIQSGTGDMTLTTGATKRIKIGTVTAGSFIDIGTTNSETLITGDLKALSIVGTAASSQINIGSNLGGGNVTMGANLGSTGRLNFGSASSITNCFGTVRSSVIEQLSSVSGISIGAGQTASTDFVKIGGNVARTGDIEIGKSMTAGAINIGTAISGTASVNIGSTTRPTSSNGSYIVDTVPLTNGSARNMEIRYGSATNVPSLSYMFCRKNTSTLTTLTTFSIGAPTDQSCEFFEIIITGSNNGYGPYSYKGCFGIDKQGITMSATAVTTIFAFNATPTITFTAVGTFNMDMKINCAFGSSSNQNFIATLVCFPSTSPAAFGDLYYDYDVTPIA